MTLIEEHLAEYPDLEVVEVLADGEDTILLGMSDTTVHMYIKDEAEWFILSIEE